MIGAALPMLTHLLHDVVATGTLTEDLSSVLSMVTTFITSVISWFTSVAELATSNVLVMIFLIAVPLTTFAISVVLWIVRSRARKA